MAQVRQPAKKARGRPPKPKTENYFAEILSWEIDYSLSGAEKYDFVEEAFWESFRVSISGRLIAPAKLAGLSLDISVLGSRRYDEVMTNSRDYSKKAKGVGSLKVWGQTREVYVTYPWSALWGLLPALQAEAVKIVDMHGEALHRGSALLTSVAFRHHVNPDDY